METFPNVFSGNNELYNAELVSDLEDEGGSGECL
jgi:hypothetical protein